MREEREAYEERGWWTVRVMDNWHGSRVSIATPAEREEEKGGREHVL